MEQNKTVDAQNSPTQRAPASAHSHRLVEFGRHVLGHRRHAGARRASPLELLLMLCAALLAFAAAAGALTMGCVALAQPRGTALAAGAAGVRTFAASQKAGAHAAEIKKKVPTPAVNWREPTGGKQPDLRKMSDISVDVDLQKQRAYVKSHGKTVYTMVISSGMDGSTPTGTWTLPMGQRGEHFYNPNEKMGADYWIRIHGEYLFHTVPTTQKMGDYIASEGAKLGKPASHGCIRLSIADAKWLYNELPDNTPVHIY